MNRTLLLAVSAAAAVMACSRPNAAKCSQNSDCPRDAICAAGVCQKGAPSGGAASFPAAAGTLTAGTMTMEATLGENVTPAGTSGTRTMAPAQNTR